MIVWAHKKLGRHLYLVMELCSGGELFDKIIEERREEQTVWEAEVDCKRRLYPVVFSCSFVDVLIYAAYVIIRILYRISFYSVCLDNAAS